MTAPAISRLTPSLPEHDEAPSTQWTRTARTMRTVAGPPVRWWMRLDIDGAGLVPASGPVLLAATHASHADTLALGAAAPRPLSFLGSDHLPHVLQHFGMLPINRGSGDAAALHRCLSALDAGAALVIYPEGGRSRDGRVYRPRSGVARLAAAMGCPVVPVGITGTAAMWRPGQRPSWRRGHVAVRFGPPIAPPTEGPAARRAFNNDLHHALVALSGLPPAGALLPPAADEAH